jgi:hypothetical protein
MSSRSLAREMPFRTLLALVVEDTATEYGAAFWQRRSCRTRAAEAHVMVTP